MITNTKQINGNTPLSLSSQLVNYSGVNTHAVVDQIEREYSKRGISRFFAKNNGNYVSAISICQMVVLDGIYYQKAIIENKKDKFCYMSKGSIYNIMFNDKYTIIDGTKTFIEKNKLDDFLENHYYWNELFKKGMSLYNKINWNEPILTFETDNLNN